jgi:ParB family chromosome partitioning protein
MAGLTTIPALVRTFSSQHQLEVSLVENLQRRDLNAIETATAYLKLRNQFNLSLEEIGKRVGNKSGSAVANTLRLLKLPKFAQTAVAEGKVNEGQIKPLIGEDDAFIAEILPRIIAEQWSARKVEQYMVNIKKDRTDSAATSPATERFESRLQHFKSRLNTNVAIRMNSRGAGQIVIRFKDEADFERIEKLLDN